MGGSGEEGGGRSVERVVGGNGEGGIREGVGGSAEHSYCIRLTSCFLSQEYFPIKKQDELKLNSR